MRDGSSDFRLTENRLPVERFANCLSRIVSVWVYWTTCRVQISFQPDLHTWARHQAKKLERVLCTNWLARTRKSHDIQRKQWQMQTIIAVKKQANKITEGLRTFQRCFLEKQITITQSRYNYYFCVEFIIRKILTVLTAITRDTGRTYAFEGIVSIIHACAIVGTGIV